MDSPAPDSPISTDASGSPPPEDLQFNANRDQQKTTNVAVQPIAQSPTAPKRPLHRVPSSEKSSFRETKFRRREVKGNTENRGSGTIPGQPRGDYLSRRDKEELVDIALVEQLRKDFGDPFLDIIRFKDFR